MNKSLVTNTISLLILIISFFNIPYQDTIRSIGAFSFSGAITNWLAIHMLFEKVPFLYGSGVIPLRFNEFKSGIYDLIIGEFFSEERLKAFFEGIDFSGVGIDYNKTFDSFIESLMSSELGAMIEMIGGVKALEPARPTVVKKMESIFNKIASSTDLLDPKIVKTQIESVVNQRLDELTPQGVKRIVQNMIREHLGWLVIWGGVFGGLIGLIMGI